MFKATLLTISASSLSLVWSYDENLATSSSLTSSTASTAWYASALVNDYITASEYLSSLSFEELTSLKETISTMKSQIPETANFTRCNKIG